MASKRAVSALGILRDHLEHPHAGFFGPVVAEACQEPVADAGHEFRALELRCPPTDVADRVLDQPEEK